MHPFRPLSQVTSADQVSATHEVMMADLASILDTDDGTTAAELLQRLQRTMPHHFRLEEERDGVFDWIVMLRPELGPQVDALLSDHETLLTELGALGSPIGKSGQHDEAQTLALCAFAEHLRQHERRESLALQQAMESAAEET